MLLISLSELISIIFSAYYSNYCKLCTAIIVISYRLHHLPCNNLLDCPFTTFSATTCQTVPSPPSVQQLARLSLYHLLYNNQGGCENFRFRNFAKFEGNFATHELKIFANISRNTKSKFGQNFRHFAKHEIKVWATFLLFCKKEMIFLLQNFLKIIYFLDFLEPKK